MLPCNFNAKCNISPVIIDYFIATKSMQNIEAFDHTNGLSKYVCKYIAKFDDGNYVVVSQNTDNGQIVLGKTHLHNTKIVRSSINEQKAYEKNRKETHPRGCDMPHFEIRQLLMGHPEVFINIELIKISTLPLSFVYKILYALIQKEMLVPIKLITRITHLMHSLLNYQCNVYE